MTSYVENETEVELPFNIQEIVARIMETVMEMEKCPYETTVNLLLTGNSGIREYNKAYRNIDCETDVLSFPNIHFEHEGDFTSVEENTADYFDPDTGELILGDIILSVDRVLSQAKEYGHSILREFAFLVAHSMFHMCGYDHVEEQKADIMEKKQEAVLTKLGIKRNI